MSRGMASGRISHALSHARPMASEMTVGCAPEQADALVQQRSAQHRDARGAVARGDVLGLGELHEHLRRGCDTSILFKMVAPSLVMVTSLFALTNILSIPRGPRDVRERHPRVSSRRSCCHADVVLQLVAEYRSPALEALSAGARNGGRHLAPQRASETRAPEMICFRASSGRTKRPIGAIGGACRDLGDVET